MTASDSRLSRLARALAVVVSRPPVAMASTPLKLRNPLNGVGLSTSRGSRMASNARRQRERWAGRTLGIRLGTDVHGLTLTCVSYAAVLTRISPRPFDDDNNAAALKSVRDGMAEAWGIDDADPRVTWVTDWRKGPKDAVEAALWVLPHASEPLVVEPTCRPLPHADAPTLHVGPPLPPPGRVIQDFDADDYNGRPPRNPYYVSVKCRKEVRVTPNVVRKAGGA